MYTYQITTGELLNNSGEFIGTGYSGAGLTIAYGRNNPDMVSVHNKGPIPPGFYSIGLPYTHHTEGPCVMNLTPLSETDDFGRSAFHIHGNNVNNNASQGCIILGPSIRAAIAKSGDNELKVIV